MYPKDTVQVAPARSRMAGSLALISRSGFDAEMGRTRVVKRILHNLSLLFERTFETVQDFETAYRKGDRRRAWQPTAPSTATLDPIGPRMRRHPGALCRCWPPREGRTVEGVPLNGSGRRVRTGTAIWWPVWGNVQGAELRALLPSSRCRRWPFHRGTSGPQPLRNFRIARSWR